MLGQGSARKGKDRALGGGRDGRNGIVLRYSKRCDPHEAAHRLQTKRPPSLSRMRFEVVKALRSLSSETSESRLGLYRFRRVMEVSSACRRGSGRLDQTEHPAVANDNADIALAAA
jgi:hypothetical protein